LGVKLDRVFAVRKDKRAAAYWPFKLNVKQRKLITERRRESQPLQKIAADLSVGATTV
jgi:5-formyltetrahydrofolate cyclo-ligase